jgi:flagellin
MPIVVNSNVAATTASFNLSHANDALRKSLARLSSGKRIVNPADDAGGMAVAYKLNSALQRTEAVRQNIQNGISYLQVQDGALAVTGKILSRMAELRTMASDITKNSSDIENYSKEFVELQSQMHQIRQQKFNGLSLFAVSGMATADFSGNPPQININTDGGVYTSSNGTQTYDKYSRTLYTHESGLEQDGSISLNVVNLQFVLSLGASGDLGGFNNPGSSDTIALNGTQFLRDIEDFDISLFTRAIEKLSDMRAENGAEQNRLSMASDLLALNQTNLEAAHGRIMDADIALESTRMARQNVLVQASASMVAQANQLTSIALTVLG